MKKVFKAYTDPGHGWVKVPRNILKELDILSKISSCSYQRGDDVYLEEDCDLGEFHNAYMIHNKRKPEYRSQHTNKESKIRSYEMFLDIN